MPNAIQILSLALGLAACVSDEPEATDREASPVEGRCDAEHTGAAGDAGCTADRFCNRAGVCKPRKADGAACRRDRQCDSDVCELGVCESGAETNKVIETVDGCFAELVGVPQALCVLCNDGGQDYDTATSECVSSQ